MKNNKGFTILEIIVVIALIGLIWMVFSNAFGGHLRNLGNELDDMNNLETRDTLLAYTQLHMNNHSLNFFFNDDGEIVTCIRVSTLIKEGFLDESFLEENNMDQNRFFRVVINNRGELNYNSSFTYNATTNQAQCGFNLMNMTNVVSTDIEYATLGTDWFNLNVTVAPSIISTFSVDTDFFTQTSMAGEGDFIFADGWIRFNLHPQFNQFFEVVSHNPNRITITNNHIDLKISPLLFRPSDRHRSLQQLLGFEIRLRPGTSGNLTNTNITLFNNITVTVINGDGVQRQSVVPINLDPIPLNRTSAIAMN